MKFKRVFLIAAAACAIALTGCAAQSEYYGVFVSEGTYSDKTERVEFQYFFSGFVPEETSESPKTESVEFQFFFSGFVPEETSESPAVSTPLPETPSITETTAAITSASEPPTASHVTSSTPAPSTTPVTTPESQTTPAAPSTASSKISTPATAATAAPYAPSTFETPSTAKTQNSTHAPSANAANPATAPETSASTKKSETAIATVAAAIDEPAPAEDYINEVLRLVNVERANEGLSPLVLDSELSKAARERAEEQVELFGHTRPNGESCFSIFKEYGISYSTAGENAAAGYSNPEDVVKAWMSSDGHRANILKPCFEKLGVGFVYSEGSYGAYWVQLFVEE